MAFSYRTWGQSWDESWEDSWGGVSAEASLGIAAVRMPTDFVISPPYYMHEIQTYRNAIGLAAAQQHTEFADAAEEREMGQLVEMMKLYATFAQ